jgi:hypothetical protein
MGCPRGRPSFRSLQSRTGTTGKGGRPFAWYFQHFEPVDKEKYRDDATYLFGKKGNDAVSVDWDE